MVETNLSYSKVPKEIFKKGSLSANLIRIGGFILLLWLAAECLSEISKIENHYENHYINTFERLTSKN